MSSITANPLISVIVPVYNTARYLDRTIEALLGQDFASGDRELIFVDNGSTDGSLEILRSHPELRVFTEPVQSSYMARNLGVRQAAGRILAFTDSDCSPEPGWLSAIATALAGTEVDIIMGPRVPLTPIPALELISDYENLKAELVFKAMDPLVYFGYTNNMAMRKSVMDRFGPFEHRARGSDTIFVRRVVDGSGCNAVSYCQRMIVRHAELESISAYYRKIAIYSRSRRAYGHIIKVRPLSTNERLGVFRRIAREKRLTDTIMLITLLIGGMIAWWWGGLQRTARAI